MPWHYRHFPTFGPCLRAVRRFYAERDLFEKIGINLITWGGLAYLIFLGTFSAPINFPSGAYVKVSSGESVREIAQDFEDRGVVNSAGLFKILVRALGDDKHIPAGTYFFADKQNMIWVAERLVAGDFETTPIKVTIIEGATNQDIAKLLLQKLPEFGAQNFLKGAREGYMFPDTYFFRPGDDASAILSVFANNFQVQLRSIQKQVAASGHSLDDLVTMASLLEKEASKTEDRRMLAGILWHRIAIGMPLQVDAVFPYIIGKNSFQLTLNDLKIESPYNTYTNKGLPVGPIDNPSLDSILAAATPIKSNYLYYLSDKDGNFHYAVTYAQHMANRAKYIGN